MYRCKHRLLAFSLSVCLVGVSTAVATTQAQPGSPSGDGLLRSELSLGGRTATITYAPDLKANDPAHKALMSNAAGSPHGRVRVGHQSLHQWRCVMRWICWHTWRRCGYV